tara:strand:+ start:1473 stop:2732 length:1260 start_codon:yes stop_codon:yes gene_type:complete
MNTTINIEDWDNLSQEEQSKITKVIFTGTKKVSDVKDRPSMAFATMCKNEEHCIGVTLAHAGKHCDYVVVADNGSTDNTFNVVRQFFAESGLPGSWHVDSWEGYAINKTKMLSYVKDKTEYLLHLDADDRISEDFYFNHEDAGYDYYTMKLLRGSASWNATTIYKNDLIWRFIGTAHTIIKANKDNLSQGDLTNRGYCNCDGIGSRAFDPKKYLYDGERLTKQFWDCLLDDPEGLLTRSVFYAGQSYMDYGVDGSNEKALQWYRLYLRLEDTWIEERYEAQMRLSRILMRLDDHKDRFNEIKNEMDKAIAIFDDRAEAYYFFGEYCGQIGKYELSYEYLKKAQACNLQHAENNYILFIQQQTYGVYINNWLSVACYWTNRIEEGKALVTDILDNHKETFKDMIAHYEYNLEQFNNAESR